MIILRYISPFIPYSKGSPRDVNKGILFLCNRLVPPTFDWRQQGDFVLILHKRLDDFLVDAFLCYSASSSSSRLFVIHHRSHVTSLSNQFISWLLCFTSTLCDWWKKEVRLDVFFPKESAGAEFFVCRQDINAFLCVNTTCGSVQRRGWGETCWVGVVKFSTVVASHALDGGGKCARTSEKKATTCYGERVRLKTKSKSLEKMWAIVKK
jgi:hypothetical protein